MTIQNVDNIASMDQGSRASIPLLPLVDILVEKNKSYVKLILHP